MKTLLTILLIIVSLISLRSCSRHDIKLDIVRHTPYYFRNDLLFGEDGKAMEERNAFILQTGLIDTTDERPPQEVAFISVGGRIIQLDFVERNRTGPDITIAYAGGGYTLLLLYSIYEKNGVKMYDNERIVVNQGKLKSDFRVYAKKGYQ